MENTGKVVSTQGKTAYVQVRRASACGGDCGKCIGCASAGTTVKLENNISAQKGDLVKIVSKKDNLLTAVFYAYIIPLIVFFGSYLLILSRFSAAGQAENLELKALAGAVAIMAVSYCILRFFSKKLSKSKRFELCMEKYEER
ncbi:MAG: SoxR reducing system RseC family protein [Caulobacteraceae bacterium]